MRFIRHKKFSRYARERSSTGYIPKPYVVGDGEVTPPLYSSLTLSIACPIVFHTALYAGLNSARDFSLHTFSKSVLQQLETAPGASWKASFRPLASAHIGSAPLGPLPKKMTIRFGAHRTSIYGTTTSAKTMVLTATAKDQARESHARELTGRQTRPKIRDEEFPDYQKLLDNAEVEPPFYPARSHYSPDSPFHIGKKTRG